MARSTQQGSGSATLVFSWVIYPRFPRGLEKAGSVVFKMPLGHMSFGEASNLQVINMALKYAALYWQRLEADTLCDLGQVSFLNLSFFICKT